MKAETARRFSDILDFFRSFRRVITSGEHEIKLVKKEIRRCLKQGEYYALYKMPDWKHELYKVTEEYFENQGYKIRYVEHNNVEIWWGRQFYDK